MLNLNFTPPPTFSLTGGSLKKVDHSELHHLNHYRIDVIESGDAYYFGHHNPNPIVKAPNLIWRVRDPQNSENVRDSLDLDSLEFWRSNGFRSSPFELGSVKETSRLIDVFELKLEFQSEILHATQSQNGTNALSVVPPLNSYHWYYFIFPKIRGGEFDNPFKSTNDFNFSTQQVINIINNNSVYDAIVKSDEYRYSHLYDARYTLTGLLNESVRCVDSCEVQREPQPLTLPCVDSCGTQHDLQPITLPCVENCEIQRVPQPVIVPCLDDCETQSVPEHGINPLFYLLIMSLGLLSWFIKRGK